MDAILQIDIFFFITSLAVVVISAVLLVAGVYLIKILRDVSYVLRRVRKETDDIIGDVHDARKFVKKEVKRAVDVKELVEGVVRLVLQRGKKRSPRRKKEA